MGRMLRRCPVWKITLASLLQLDLMNLRDAGITSLPGLIPWHTSQIQTFALCSFLTTSEELHTTLSCLKAASPRKP
jgi:hypothetical protein